MNKEKQPIATFHCDIYKDDNAYREVAKVINEYIREHYLDTSEKYFVTLSLSRDDFIDDDEVYTNTYIFYPGHDNEPGFSFCGFEDDWWEGEKDIRLYGFTRICEVGDCIEIFGGPDDNDQDIIFEKWWL